MVPVQKFRDVKKLCAAKTDGKTDYVLFCAEAQLRVHLAMPVRNSLYDALAYAEQVEAAANSHHHAMEEARKKTKAEQLLKESQGTRETSPAEESSHDKGGGETAEKKKLDPGEFLGGFWKEDRLIPVVTLTVWLGPGEWEGPRSLFEMLDRRDPELLPYMNDYRMNLAAPGMMTDEEILRCQTGLREVMFFIKYSKDRKKLAEIMDSDRERFENLERRAADMIEAVTGTRMHHEEGDETVNVCKAILDIQQEAYILLSFSHFFPLYPCNILCTRNACSRIYISDSRASRISSAYFFPSDTLQNPIRSPSAESPPACLSIRTTSFGLIKWLANSFLL